MSDTSNPEDPEPTLAFLARADATASMPLMGLGVNERMKSYTCNQGVRRQAGWQGGMLCRGLGCWLGPVRFAAG